MVTGGAGPSYMAAESHLAAVSYCPVAAIAVRLPRRPTFAFLGGARLGKSLPNAPMLQEKTEISLSRALLVPEGVPRAPSL
jgi:hypothetical protein